MSKCAALVFSPQTDLLILAPGFYTTSNLDQAKRWARLQAQRRRSGSALVSVYEINEAVFESLSLLRFERANAAWLDFVVENRKGLYQGALYDIVIEPSPTIAL